MSETLKRLWTDAIAYVALIIGAGLSIAGNVADTFRTRGQATDPLDIVMAIAWPALVILMVEIFVSPRWVGLAWPMQWMRWAGTLAIGGMAMRVSWVHLNDLMSSRGQKQDVSVFGPLAIDLLAIMATALILAGRRRVQESNPVQLAKPGQRIGQADLDRLVQESKPESKPVQASVQESKPESKPAQMSPELDRELDRMDKELDRILSEADLLDTDGHAWWDADGQARIYALTGKSNGLNLGHIAALLGGWYGVSAKTVQRAPWWKRVSQVARGVL